MGIIHGTIVMCKTVRNFLCCQPLNSHPVPIEQSVNPAQQTLYEYQGLLQEDTTLEIKDSKTEIEIVQQENQLEELSADCQIDKKLILDSPTLHQNFLAQITAPLEGWQQIYKEKKKPHQLTIYSKSYTTQENNKVNILRSTFFVPSVLPQTWVKFYNDSEIQRGLDTKLDRYVVVENYKNYYIIYSSYRKMLMIDSRDMLYFKTIKPLGNYITDVCKSIELTSFPLVESKTRADIFLGGYAVSEHVDSVTQQPGTLVQMYSDVDMKMNVPALISRPAAIKELKGYIEKAIEKIGTIKDKYINIPDIN